MSTATAEPVQRKRSMLTYILLGLAVLAILFVIVVSSRRADFRITRSATIAAPPAEVFAHVNDFHKWEAWSPWAKLDPNAKNSFEGPTLGEGAKFAWAGNNEVGEGKMTILESKPGELVKIKLEFLKPFKATNTAEFTFKPEGEHAKVTWSMYGKNNFIGKAFHLFVDCDKMVGKDFEKGLASMREVVESGELVTQN